MRTLNSSPFDIENTADCRVDKDDLVDELFVVGVLLSIDLIGYQFSELVGKLTVRKDDRDITSENTSAVLSLGSSSNSS
jgi:hypothetical protein